MVVLSAAPMVMAQAPASEKEMLAAFEKEGPLTQKDIDGYLKLIPKAQDAAADPAKAAALYKEAGFTEVRGNYVGTKMGIAMMMIDMGDNANAVLDENQIPKILRPTTDEVALVKKNLEAIKDAVSIKK